MGNPRARSGPFVGRSRSISGVICGQVWVRVAWRGRIGKEGVRPAAVDVEQEVVALVRTGQCGTGKETLLFKIDFFGPLFCRVSKVRKGGGTCFLSKIDRAVKGPQMTTGSYEMHFWAGKWENEM